MEPQAHADQVYGGFRWLIEPIRLGRQARNGYHPLPAMAFGEMMFQQQAPKLGLGWIGDRAATGLSFLELRRNVPIPLRYIVQVSDKFQCLVAVEESMMELVTEGFQAGAASRVAVLDTSSKEFFGRAHDFLPTTKDLI